MFLKRTLEMLAMLIIGDGVLTVVDTHRHISLWDAGWWHPLLRWFSDHPQLTRIVAVAGVAAGVLLASQQRATSGRLVKASSGTGERAQPIGA
jgi:hypothetical protein